MEKERGGCIIVDAYSSGNLLAPEVTGRGLKCVHVQSSPSVPGPALSSFRREHFLDNIIHDEDMVKTLDASSRHNPVCVIAGSETGVELADVLSERLGLLSNGSRLSDARRDKFSMTSQVKRNGLRTIPSLKTRAYGEALGWVEGRVGWPVVVKPLRSGGSDSVTVCRSGDDLLRVFGSMLGRRDQLGNVIVDLLVQKKMEGLEYVVDTVSCRSSHRVANLWFIVKRRYNSGDFVCDYNELLSHSETHGDIVRYTFAVLDALGIRQGAAHTELIVTDEGPVLVETGARLHGSGFPAYSRECIGYGQVDLTVDAYVDERAFEEKSRAPYALQKKLVIVDLISRAEGILKDLPHLADIRSLPSYHSMKLFARPDTYIKKTVDVFTSPGFVVLIHPEMETIRRDYAYIRETEARGMYCV
jgi:biotin carboxylase